MINEQSLPNIPKNLPIPEKIIYEWYENLKQAANWELLHQLLQREETPTPLKNRFLQSEEANTENYILSYTHDSKKAEKTLLKNPTLKNMKTLWTNPNINYETSQQIIAEAYLKKPTLAGANFCIKMGYYSATTYDQHLKLLSKQPKNNPLIQELLLRSLFQDTHTAVIKTYLKNHNNTDQLNRAENLLKSVQELASADLLALTLLAEQNYPGSQIKQLWKTLLKQQPAATYWKNSNLINENLKLWFEDQPTSPEQIQQTLKTAERILTNTLPAGVSEEQQQIILNIQLAEEDQLTQIVQNLNAEDPNVNLKLRFLAAKKDTEIYAIKNNQKALETLLHLAKNPQPKDDSDFAVDILDLLLEYSIQTEDKPFACQLIGQTADIFLNNYIGWLYISDDWVRERVPDWFWSSATEQDLHNLLKAIDKTNLIIVWEDVLDKINDPHKAYAYLNTEVFLKVLERSDRTTGTAILHWAAQIWNQLAEENLWEQAQTVWTQLNKPLKIDEGIALLKQMG